MYRLEDVIGDSMDLTGTEDMAGVKGTIGAETEATTTKNGIRCEGDSILPNFRDSGDAKGLPSFDYFGEMNRGQVDSNRRGGGTRWSHPKSLPGIATGEP